MYGKNEDIPGIEWGFNGTKLHNPKPKQDVRWLF